MKAVPTPAEKAQPNQNNTKTSQQKATKKQETTVKVLT